MDSVENNNLLNKDTNKGEEKHEATPVEDKVVEDEVETNLEVDETEGKGVEAKPHEEKAHKETHQDDHHDTHQNEHHEKEKETEKKTTKEEVHKEEAHPEPVHHDEGPLAAKPIEKEETHKENQVKSTDEDKHAGNDVEHEKILKEEASPLANSDMEVDSNPNQEEDEAESKQEDKEHKSESEDAPQVESVPEEIHDSKTTSSTVEEPKKEEESDLSKNQRKMEQQMHDLIADGNKFKEIGNKLTGEKQYKEAEIAYRSGIETIFKFVPSTMVDVPSPDMMKYLADIGNLTKLLHSNLSFALANQKNFFESINIAQQIVDTMDPNFFKAYVRILDGALNINDMTLANKTADTIKLKFPPHVVESAKEYLKILELRNKEQEDKLAARLNKGMKKQTQSDNSANASKDTSVSEDKPNKIYKPFKRWFNWVLAPILFIGGATGIYLLLKNRSKFFK